MKHFSSFVAAAAMLSVSFIPVYLPAPLEMKIMLVCLSLGGLAAFTAHLLLQNREDRRKELENSAAFGDLKAQNTVIYRELKASGQRFQEFALVSSPKPAPIPVEVDSIDDKLLASAEQLDPELLKQFFVAEIDIRDRLRMLARDLFDFLKEQGPGPHLSEEPEESLRGYIGRVWEPLGLWINSVHNGYDEKFREQLESLMRELADKGITDTGIELREINPPHGQTDIGIRAIAEKLFILAAKLDIAEVSKQS